MNRRKFAQAIAIFFAGILTAAAIISSSSTSDTSFLRRITGSSDK